MSMDLTGKKVCVVGSGLSGVGAVELLEKVSAKPILYDSNKELKEEEVRARFANGTKVPMYFGELPDDVRQETELLILSPGVPADTPFVEEFRQRGIRVWGEIELAYAFSKGNVIAITGTNGKTTTTALVGQIMKDYFKNEVFVVGNIGNPYTQAALQTTEKSVVVAEISSFQLETIEQFKPAVSAILNITPDHLNRHHTMENYIETKQRVAENQGSDETVVLNYEDENTRKFGEKTKARPFYFSIRHTLSDGIDLRDGVITYEKDGVSTPVVAVNEMQLLGDHNVENVMAAAAVAISFHVPIESIAATIRAFKAVAHRIEFVREVNGVAYYNDSKGTNVDAAIKGIGAMNRKTYLIGGGYDKQSEYDEWIEAFDGKVQKLVLIGQTAEKIAACARKHGFDDIIMAGELKEAVDTCYRLAKPGEAVLLSPACASWGQFKNYEQRGDLFKEYVRKL